MPGTVIRSSGCLGAGGRRVHLGSVDGDGDRWNAPFGDVVAALRTSRSSRAESTYTSFTRVAR